MNKIFYSLVLVVGVASAKPLSFCENANRLSEVAVDNYIIPIIDQTLIDVGRYGECNNFTNVLKRYKQDLISNDMCALQSGFKEFIYLHEVLDRFFRAIVDRTHYKAIDLVAYFIVLFNEFFKFENIIEIQEEQEMKQIMESSDDVLIERYYSLHNQHYNKLYECFNHSVRGKKISEIDTNHLHGFNVRVALDTYIDLMTVIRNHSEENSVLKEIFDGGIHFDLLTVEQKAKALHVLAEDENLWKRVCYHYAEIAALSDFLGVYIKNLNFDNISINLFWSFITYIDYINKNRNSDFIRNMDYLVATSFGYSETVVYSLQNIANKETDNLRKLGIPEEK